MSHVVLMCNKGEMNKEMTEVVKLVADAIQNTKENIITNPSVFIILNMMTKVNEQARLDCVNQLQSELIEMNQADTVNQVLKITPENIFPLG